MSVDIGWQCPNCKAQNISDSKDCEESSQLCETCKSDCDVQVEITAGHVEVSIKRDDHKDSK